MQRPARTTRSAIFLDFLEIDDRAYHQRIRFYETHEEEIENLPEEEAFSLKEAYCDALFQVGAYHRHLALVDELIEETIQQNIRFFRGEDIFQGLLFRKAASLYQTRRYREAEHILRELLRINPAFKDPVSFLGKCMRRNPPDWLPRLRAFSVLLFILAALIISIEMLFVRPVFPEWSAGVQTSRFVLIGTGVFFLLSGEAWHRLEVRQQVSAFVKQARRRKKWDES